MKYDYLVVGAGLYGAVFAHEAMLAGKKCLVIDKRDHIGGNIHCQEISGIRVHQYGAHIFHTSNKRVWYYVNQFITFNRYINSPVANYLGEIYNLPFNMNTFNRLWGVVTPEQAECRISEQRQALRNAEPRNLEEQAISLVGSDIYEKLIKGYTEKQWGRKCTDLPASIIRRLPVRFIYDNNYFDDPYQGIPNEGYNQLAGSLLDGSDIRLNTSFIDHREEYSGIAERIVYTGAIDEYYDYRFGTLEYRSLRFETEFLDRSNYQGNAVVNYTDGETPYTRIIEHKHFEFGRQTGTVITKEYPAEWRQGLERYYPVNDEKNQALYGKYAQLAKSEKHVLFGGRLAEYKYYNMDTVIASALDLTDGIF